MSIMAILGSIGPVAKVLLKGLELVDPKTRDWVRRRKALEWGEQYILKNMELLALTQKEKPTEKEIRRIKKLIRKLKWYSKQFFLND